MLIFFLDSKAVLGFAWWNQLLDGLTDELI
jgi:hypothetical protein